MLDRRGARSTLEVMKRIAVIVVCVFMSLALWTANAHAAPVTSVFSVDGVKLRSFPTITPGSSIATGDINNDEDPEIVTGSPPGVRAQVSVYATDGTLLERFYPYGSGMKAGINVAVGDLEGSGFSQIVVAPRKGAGPQVLLYSIDGQKLSNGIWAYSKKLSSGVNLAVADIDGEGRAEIIMGVGPGSAPHLTAFRSEGTRLWNTFPYDMGFRGGLGITTFDVDGNGTPEIIVAPQAKAKADVAIIDPLTRTVRSTFRAFGNYGGGVSIAGLHVGTQPRIVVGAGAGGGPDVQQYDPTTGQTVARHFFAFDATWRGGVNVAAIDINSDGQQEIMTVPGVATLSAAELAADNARYVEPQVNGVSYSDEKVQAATGFFYTHILRADLDAPNLIVKTVASTDGDCEGSCPVHPLQYYVDQAGGFAGVNGSYFCPASDTSCAWKVGTYFWLWYNSVSGTFVNMTQNPFNVDPVLAFGGQNAPYWYPISKDFHSKEEFEATNGVSLTALLSNTPMLVQDGKLVVKKSSLDASQRLIKATRVGIGLKGRTLVIFVAQHATVVDLAYVAVALGLESALNLDGGSSTALTYNNMYKAGPGRNVPNAIVLATR